MKAILIKHFVDIKIALLAILLMINKIMLN